MDVKIVSAPGLKSKWKIPPQDVVMVEDEAFVKLKAESFTLMGMVYESNDDAPPVESHVRRHQSLCCCIGFNMLTKLRNAAQDEAERPAQGGCTLFEAEGSAQKKPKVHVSRLEAQSKRAEPAAMDMDISVQGTTYSIKVLQKVVGRDAVYVRCDPETLGPVIQFMRTNGFTSKPRSYFKHHGATGLRKRPTGFVVKKKGLDGKNTYKLIKGDLEEAIMEQHLEEPGIEDAEQDTAAAGRGLKNALRIQN